MPLRNKKQKNPQKSIAPLRITDPPKRTLPHSLTSPDIIVDLKRKKEYSGLIGYVQRQYRNREHCVMPTNIKPMLASITKQAFDNKDWQFEIKWDGYRALAYTSGQKAELRSRNNLSYNEKYTDIIDALKEWPVQAVLDGEVVVLTEDGKADFGALQNWHTQKQGTLLYYVFDLLWVEGIDLTNEPLTVRKAILRKLLADTGIIRFSDSIDECGIDFFNTAKNNGLEGIIAKQKDGVYRPGTRTETWYKIKAETRHEAIICGYTKKKDSDRLISSLILGILRNGTLEYIGQVGTGFTGRMQQKLFKKMNPLFTRDCPFEKKPRTGAPTMWVKPQLVCEVKYTALTKDGFMRHPSFQGLRDDKTATEFNMEGWDAEKINKQPVTAQNKNATWRDIIQGKESVRLTVDAHELRFTNLNKPYWPREQITKGGLIQYYYEMAPHILPYLIDRPQSLNRFPNGIDGKSFYQKDVKGKIEKWLTTFERVSDSNGGLKKFFVCTDTASLLYMANLGCIEINPWHSKISTPDFPDWCVIDLDPGAIAFEKVIETARVIYKLLDSLAVPSFPKTSGSTGMHIYIPLGGRYNYEQSRQLAELIALLVHNELPSFTSLTRNPEKRKDKIYIDYLQNRPIQTICAPYSVRPKQGATVSAPLHWQEVKKGLRLSQFTITNMLARVKSEGDLFKGVLQKGIELSHVLKAIEHLI